QSKERKARLTVGPAILHHPFIWILRVREPGGSHGAKAVIISKISLSIDARQGQAEWRNLSDGDQSQCRDGDALRWRYTDAGDQIMEALSGFKHMIPLALAAQRIQDQNSIQCSPRGRSAIQIRAIAERPGQAIDDRTPTTREL
ncbi:hypothetical protein T310_8813, partial [Rasamsonia emersonii CBS 393.64]